MTKMFKSVSETWNPFVGCLAGCSYCFARKMSARFKKRYLANRTISEPVFLPYRMKYGGDDDTGYDPYADPFYPRFWPERLKKTFKPGETVFVCSMSDIMGEWWPTEWILAVLDRIRLFPKTDFLLCTKNPERYGDFDFSPNVILGTTLETNHETWKYSWAASPALRQHFLAANPHPRKFISIEPIMDMDVAVMLDWVRMIAPEIVEVGADSTHNHLPEPLPHELRALLAGLRLTVPRVIEKEGLERLLK
jgi:protein gp37